MSKKDNNKEKRRETKFQETMKKVWWYIRTILYYTHVVLRTILSWLISTLFYAGITGCICGALYLYINIYPIYQEYDAEAKELVDACDSKTFKLEEPSYIYNDSGRLLIKLRGNQDSSYLEYEEIPEYAINAFIAVEDRTFWENEGIDLKGIVRVVYDAVRTKGKEVHGASTITQQLARNIFLTHEVSLERKGKEMLIALRLTDKFSKRDIIEFYINDICYANAYYGLDAAARGYFNKNANELSLGEITYLCAIPNSPEYYDPYKNPDNALDRRKKILGDMLSLNYITQEEYDEAVDEKVNITKPTFEFSDYQTTYAIECATQYIMQLDGFEFQYEFTNQSLYDAYEDSYKVAYENAKNKLYTQGYKIYTSLNDKQQQLLQNAVDDGLKFSETVSEDGIYDFQGAATAIDNNTGKVVAIVGGRSQEQQTYSLNRAYQSPRQPGSSIKPLIDYAPALENGYNDKSILVNIDVSKAKEKGVIIGELPGNQVDLRTAVEKSLNGCAMWLFDKITPRVGMSYITRMNFSHICPDDYYAASSIGGLTHGVTTVEMASAYSTLANEGRFRNPTCITSIKDINNEEIFVEDKEKVIYDANTANNMIDIMKGVISKGTARGMRWSRSSDVEAAGKTGTTNDNKDGWFCGSTPYYSIAVWVGYDMPKTVKKLQGGTYPMAIWKQSMLSFLDEVDMSGGIKLFKEPESITAYAVEGWDSYLPGRSDDEILSDGYTVANYRQDHMLADEARMYINQAMQLDTSSPTYDIDRVNLYTKARTLIDQIYSRKLTAQMNDEISVIAY